VSRYCATLHDGRLLSATHSFPRAIYLKLRTRIGSFTAATALSHSRGPAPSALLLGNLAAAILENFLVSGDSTRSLQIVGSTTARVRSGSSSRIHARRSAPLSLLRGPSRRLAPAYHAVRACHTDPRGRKSLLLKALNIISFQGLFFCLRPRNFPWRGISWQLLFQLQVGNIYSRWTSVWSLT